MAVRTQIYYLERLDLYQEEKPFMLTFDPPDSDLKTNHSYKAYDADIINAQPQKQDFSLDKHGFQFEEWPTQLSSEDFDNDDIVIGRYYDETIEQVKRLSPNAMEVFAFTHLRRKRQAEAKNTGSQLQFESPIEYAHIDFTPNGAKQVVEQYLDKYPRLRGHSYDLINVWRSTKGPNRDWPLAVCDYNTIDVSDLEFNDVIHRNHIGESARLYSNPRHRWYYLDQQTTSQVVLFRNTHSDGLKKPFGMHLSFVNPDARPDHFPRESMELRLVRFMNH